jgi:pyridoxal 5'-phosphate synthase pdxT subunit
VIGVLALQGAVSEHRQMLSDIGAPHREVRQSEDFQGLQGLIIPGGESTTLEKLMRRFGLDTTLSKAIDDGLAVWGTCAGMILLASRITNGIPGQRGLGHLPISVERNAFGRQVESCEVLLDVKPLGDEPFSAVFIRAPRVVEIDDDRIEIWARLQDTIVAVRRDKVLATSFHPELTGDHRLHKLFVEQIAYSEPAAPHLM